VVLPALVPPAALPALPALEPALPPLPPALVESSSSSPQPKNATDAHTAANIPSFQEFLMP
jgi:hypothetical protein